MIKTNNVAIKQLCEIMLKIKHNFEECRKYEKQREKLNISNLFEIILGPNLNNKNSAIEFFKLVKIINLILQTISMYTIDYIFLLKSYK